MNGDKCSDGNRIRDPLSIRQLNAGARPCRVMWLSTRRLGYRSRDRGLDRCSSDGLHRHEIERFAELNSRGWVFRDYRDAGDAAP